jgi:hypothetical protein
VTGRPIGPSSKPPLTSETLTHDAAVVSTDVVVAIAVDVVIEEVERAVVDEEVDVDDVVVVGATVVDVVTTDDVVDDMVAVDTLDVDVVVEVLLEEAAVLVLVVEDVVAAVVVEKADESVVHTVMDTVSQPASAVLTSRELSRLMYSALPAYAASTVYLATSCTQMPSSAGESGNVVTVKSLSGNCARPDVWGADVM